MDYSIQLQRWLWPFIVIVALTACQSDGRASPEEAVTSQPPVDRSATAWGAGPTVRAQALPIAEGNGDDSLLSVSVTLSFRYSGVILVDYATEDRTAKAGSDYRRVKGQLKFEPGETGKTIEIPIIGDAIAEGDESFVLQLYVAHVARVEDPALVLTIVNDD